MFDTALMQTRAEFLKALGENLARYDPPRVAKIGCLTGLGLVAVAIGAGVAGVLSTSPIFPHFFRILMGVLLGSILLVFILFAALETLAERRALRQVQGYIASGAADVPTLLEMARARQGRFPGSEKVIEVLERADAPEKPGGRRPGPAGADAAADRAGKPAGPSSR